MTKKSGTKDSNDSPKSPVSRHADYIPGKAEKPKTVKRPKTLIPNQNEKIVRKTIALPEKCFIKVKIESAKRNIKAYELWGEIVAYYFENHKLS